MLRPVKEIHVLYNESVARMLSVLTQAWDSNSAGANIVSPYIKRDEWLQQAMDGSIRWNRALAIGTFIDLCKPQHILEIGSFIGLSSNFFLRLTREWDGKLTSVDANIRHRVFDEPRLLYVQTNAEFENRYYTRDGFWKQVAPSWDYEHRQPIYDLGKIKSIYANRQIVEPGDFIKEGLSFDFAFIDGSHEATDVFADFDGVLSILKPGSCVVFDDVDAVAWPSVFKALMALKEMLSRTDAGYILLGDGVALFVDSGLIEHWRKPKL